MKPHLHFEHGAWGVWRHRSVYPQQLPTVIRAKPIDALWAHWQYTQTYSYLTQRKLEQRPRD